MPPEPRSRVLESLLDYIFNIYQEDNNQVETIDIECKVIESKPLNSATDES